MLPKVGRGHAVPMDEHVKNHTPLRARWYDGIAAQLTALGAVPLAFLIAAILLGVQIQSMERNSFTHVQLSTQTVAASDRIYDLLDRESQAISQYHKEPSAANDRAVRSLDAQLPPIVSTLDQLVAASSVQVPLWHRYRGLTLAVRDILQRYHAAQSRGTAAAARIVGTPQVGATLRAWRDTKTLFDRNETTYAITTFNQSRRDILPYQRVALGLCVVGLLVTLGLFALFGTKLVRRLQRVALNADALAKAGNPTALGGNDEIGRLDEHIRSLTMQLRRTATAYRRERQVAATLQRALLPQSFPRINGLHVHTAYVSAEDQTAVGGDWYDLFEIDENLVGISVGDVAGHGIAAATLMAFVRQTVRSAARAAEDPAVVLGHVNRVLSYDERDALVSALFATFDVRKGLLRYAIAGHPPAIVVSPEFNASEISGTAGPLLGIERGTAFESYSLHVEVGSSMVFYSDGLIEHDRAPIDGLRQLVRAAEAESRNPSGNPADGLQARVLKGLRPTDDSAVMYLVYSQAAPEAVQWRKEWSFDAGDEAAATRVKRAIFWQIVDHVDASQSINIEIAYGELIANVARHTPGPVVVDLERRPGEIVLRVTDKGEPFDAAVPKSIDVFAESGRGMFLIASLAESFSVSRFEDGNRVTIGFPSVSTRSPLMVPAAV